MRDVFTTDYCKAQNHKCWKKYIKTEKSVHRPSRDRGKLVNSPFSSFKGTYSCLPNKNRATKNTPKGNVLVQSYSLLYIYIFSCFVEDDGSKNLTKKGSTSKTTTLCIYHTRVQYISLFACDPAVHNCRSNGMQSTCKHESLAWSQRTPTQASTKSQKTNVVTKLVNSQFFSQVYFPRPVVKE